MGAGMGGCLGRPRSALGIVRRSGATPTGSDAAGTGAVGALYFTGAEPIVACGQGRAVSGVTCVRRGEGSAHPDRRGACRRPGHGGGWGGGRRRRRRSRRCRRRLAQLQDLLLEQRKLGVHARLLFECERNVYTAPRVPPAAASATHLTLVTPGGGVTLVAAGPATLLRATFPLLVLPLPLVAWRRCP